MAIGTRPADSVTTLAELSKEVQTLRQKLAKASKADARPPASEQSVTLSSAIVSVQAQIERVILEEQLTKLDAGSTSGNAAKDGQAAAPAARHKGVTGTAHNKSAAVAARYQSGEPQTLHLDEKA
jgi:hypothetical protein